MSEPSLFTELVTVAILRAGQTALLCLPTLLLGMLGAGWIATSGGRNTVRNWLSRGTRSDVVRAWLFGLLVPECSIGLLPALVALKRAGVRNGSIVAVALAGPVFVPLTTGYAADRAGWLGLGWMMIGSAIITFAAAWAVEWVMPSSADSAVGEELRGSPVDTHSVKLLDVLRNAGRSLDHQAWILVVAAILGTGLVAMTIPQNAIGDWLIERSAVHAGFISFAMLLTYEAPASAAMQAGEIVRSSTMPGLLIPMMALGGAVNLGTIVGIFALVKVRRALVVVTVSFLVTGMLTAAADWSMYWPIDHPEDSHAFEDYGQPYHLLDHERGAVAGFVFRFTRPMHAGIPAAAVGMIALFLCRYLPERREEHASVPRGLTRTTSVRPTMLHRGIVWAICVAGLIVPLIYTYLPPPGDIAYDVRRLGADLSAASGQGDKNDTERLAQLLVHRLKQLRWSAWVYLSPLSYEREKEIDSAVAALEQFTGNVKRGMIPTTEERVGLQKILTTSTN